MADLPHPPGDIVGSVTPTSADSPALAPTAGTQDLVARRRTWNAVLVRVEEEPEAIEWHIHFGPAQPDARCLQRTCLALASVVDAGSALAYCLAEDLDKDPDCESYTIVWAIGDLEPWDPQPAVPAWLLDLFLPVEIMSDGTVTPALAEPDYQDWPCDAFRDGSGSSQRCGLPALFEITRVADMSIPVCASHLGPVLAFAPTVEWPLTRWSSIEWIGPGTRPPNAYSPEQADAATRLFLGVEDPPSVPDPYSAGIPARYDGTCTCCQGRIEAGNTIFVGMKTSAKKALWVCQTCHDTGTAQRHFFPGVGGRPIAGNP